MMKKITEILLLGMMLLSGCAAKEKIIAENEKVSIEILDITAEPNGRTGFTIVRLNVRITNRSKEKLSSVQYRLNVLDEKGEIIKSCSRTYLGEDKSLDPGQNVDDYYGFQDKFEKEPASFSLEVVQVRNTDELPLVHLPLEDEYLYVAIGLERLKDELPAEVYVRIDHMGALDEATITDEETIREFIGRFCRVRIDCESDTFVTDNYNGISFVFADGSKAWISLNLYSLEISNQGRMHLYDLKDFGDLWKMCVALASSDTY